uniref:Uncharacterized protein n=1 Tax=Arundo donax TaxID=35708 RepID=A0A0A9ABI1_ARUDO
MPEATPSASSKPMATNRRLGSASMSQDTTPARCLAYRIEKYTATYPKVVSWARKKGYALSGTRASL